MTMKRRFKVDKLLRDRMPDILGSQDIAIFERVLEQAEYIVRLKDKLLEETNEVLEAKSQEDVQEELADVKYYLAKPHKYPELS